MTFQPTGLTPFSGESLASLLSPAVRVLGLGEPTHGADAFLDLRNELFRHLVEQHGYRSIALESDCLAGLTADAYVADGTGGLDHATAHGFSHGFGAYPGNRELLRWMREWNAAHPAQDCLRFDGIDGPLEISGAAAPGPALTTLHGLLAAHLELPVTLDELTGLLGDPARWTDPGVMADPARSVGRTPEAAKLRLIADDLTALLAAQAPRLLAATSAEHLRSAALHARTATGLLRYHAGLADTDPERLSRLCGLRGLMMADNLSAVAEREADRGPTLVFAHNSHLQRTVSSMQFGGRRLSWWSGGALLAARLGDGYAFTATTFGARGTDHPAPDTIEGLLHTAHPGSRTVLPAPALAGALPPETPLRTPADHTYAPLDPATVGEADAVVFLRGI
ncbi:erythromycin esterase family protein [Kitasatospora sp. NPDC096147]|uniref:erythromycin esterase family protein n=1 Tax=Kitasatospora sp. NPDC096147 TaxID=3364093 RepID=UPI003823364E